MIWHDVEHGSYDADLPLWRELADATGGPVLDLGAGTGRVSLDLAAHGHDVVALDSDPELLAELAERGAVRDGRSHADARAFSSTPSSRWSSHPCARADPRRHRGRVAMLRSGARAPLAWRPLRRRALRPSDAVPEELVPPPLPDILERDGWVFSSQPLTMYEQDGCVVIERRRQAVSPSGEIQEEDVRIEVGVVEPGSSSRLKRARPASARWPGRRSPRPSITSGARWSCADAEGALALSRS